MSEVLVHFDEPLVLADGRAFVAQVMGHRTYDGRWEGWIEFLPADGVDTVRTACETRQFTRGDLRFWAARLERADLRAALDRALVPGPLVPPAVPSRIARDDGASRPAATAPDDLVDPIALYVERGEHALRHALRELDAQQLRDIITRYDIPELDVEDLARTFEDALAVRIVAAVQQRVGARSAESVISADTAIKRGV